MHPLLNALCQLPHRGAATPNEREAARLLAEHLRNRGAAVRLEAFSTPQTYATVVYWITGLLLAGIGLALSGGFLVGQLGVILGGFALSQAWLYSNWREAPVTRFPGQHRAVNVLAQWSIPDKIPVKLHVILMAHYDTAPISILYSMKRQKTARATLILSLFLMTLGVVLSIIYTFGGTSPVVFWSLWGIALYHVVLAIVSTLGYLVKGYANGASDNATGVVAAIETAVRLQAASRSGALPGTLVEVVLPSAAEAGMLGSLAYLRKNKAEWPNGGQNTIVINFNTLGAGMLTVVEQTGTVEVIRYTNALTGVARQLLVQPDFALRAQTGQWHAADFDSVWFVREGIPALALCALDSDGGMPRIHQINDVPDLVDEAPMNTAVDLAASVVEHWYKQF
ncbi:M28 family peptidase [Fibrella forsythiae]|uniref:M28 family peptidase n=1 Tax=Fibrella forsythiae TaxID=2817061 RepID=A0ABS3JCF8_9BACT|nr:M28 family peptidase [Fibrella forsythiae]MBO0947670.1 M28 family peptidase [Fibrella forsythiae]